jgi:exopolyphosphatase/guanosine-5'-triphosphate,3'-diphosphate pyrophosphatase
VIEPVHVAAIDAGSNAIRLVVARADSPARVRTLEAERYAVRLGHNVFTQGRFERKTIAQALKAFHHFHAVMSRHQVARYRAVATSATREARNRGALIRRIFRETGIRLEVIDGAEEARLVRSAVRAALGDAIAPRLVVDLGGGSLELNLMRGDVVERSVTLPLGTVRLMETYDASGPIGAEKALALSEKVLAGLRRHLRTAKDLQGSLVVACGGNAEAYAQIAPGRRPGGIPTMSLRVLANRLDAILASDVAGRMRLFRVRRDRAEVMGVAGIVFATLGRALSLREMLVPGVGVREGVLDALVSRHFVLKPLRAADARERALIARARAFSVRHECDPRHGELVRRVAVEMFDRLRPLHGMGRDQRALLEAGALVHDVGHFVNQNDHHKHGEYLVRHGRIDSLAGWRRDMLACLVRYHYKAEPLPDHKAYASLDTERQREVRALTAILRLAAGVDFDLRQEVRGVDVAFGPGEAHFTIRRAGRRAGSRAVTALARRAALFEQEFGVAARFTEEREGEHGKRRR